MQAARDRVSLDWGWAGGGLDGAKSGDLLARYLGAAA